MKQPGESLPISVFLVYGILVPAIVSVGYCLWDLILPSDFVRDFYGFVVMARLLLLGLTSLFLFVVVAILLVPVSKTKAGSLPVSGSILTIMLSLVLIGTAIHTAWSRRQWQDCPAIILSLIVIGTAMYFVWLRRQCKTGKRDA